MAVPGCKPRRRYRSRWLDAADDLIAVDALGQQHLVAGVEALKAVGLQAGLDLGHTAILGFKVAIIYVPPSLILHAVDVLDSALLGREAAVGADVLLVGFLRVLAVTDVLHHLAQTDELIADDLVVLVQSGLEDVALGQLQIADALGLGGEMVPVMERRPLPRPSRPAPTGRPFSEKAVWLRP